MKNVLPTATVMAAVSMALLSLSQTARAGDSAFDRLNADLGPYLNHHDPLSFDMKIKSISADEYTFWRGTKGLFYQWCNTHCADWLAERGAYVVSHGDLHFGNMGSYAIGWGKLAFGEIDFDESARLPFQIELLQGLITFDLLERQNQVALSADQKQSIANTMFDSYTTALASGKSATDLLHDNPTIRAMLDKPAVAYGDDVEKYVSHGQFKTPAAGKKVSNVFTPVEAARWPDFAAAIAEAAGHDPKLAALLKWQDVASIRAVIQDVASRVRTGSSGSQGLAKYVVLLKKPFKNYDGDVILYLKREIPSASERAGVVPLDPRSPGQRYAQDMATLTDPPALFSSWAVLEGGSYWVTFKEPWSDELAYGLISDFAALQNAAVIWGDVAGAAHAKAGDAGILRSKLTPALRNTLEQRAAAYAKQNAENFTSFNADSRVAQCVAAVKSAVRNLSKPD